MIFYSSSKNIEKHEKVQKCSFQVLSRPKKKNGVYPKSLERRRAVSTGKVCVRSGVVAQPPSDREAGEDTSSRGRGVADVRTRATSLLCATPPPVSQAARDGRSSPEKNQETERAFEALLHDGWALRA